MRKKRIWISVLNQGSIRVEVSHLLTNMAMQNKYEVMIEYPADKPISQNRNSIVQRFLSEPKYDYLMMLDGDIVPPLGILNLADFDFDIVSPVLFMYQKNMIIPVTFKRNKDGLFDPLLMNDMDEGIKEVDSVGTGCILIARRVLEAFKEKRIAPFINSYDADGIKLIGLDLGFCSKAKQMGFRVFTHFDYVSSHWTTFDLKQAYLGMLNLYKEITSQQKTINRLQDAAATK